jgi:hypothetical protein
MRPLSVPELLTVWERGLTANPCERALALLAAASPGSSSATLARASIGRRDARLLTLREWAFGPALAVLAACPNCGQSLETVLRIDDLRMPGDAADDAADDVTEEAESSFRSGSYELRSRPPNTEDLLSCMGPDVAASRQKLFARCVIEARHNAEPIPADRLPDEVVRQVVEQIAAGDPQADTRINLDCPECQYSWSEVFDIASFFWAEIDAWARRTLREVVLLARVYGWAERDILALSPTRRQIYLAMAEA